MIKSILRKLENRERLNILTFSGHSPYEATLCETGHNFYSIPGEHVIPWNNAQAKQPENYHTVSANVLNYIDIDLILTHNPLAHVNNFVPIMQQYNIPTICLFHTQKPHGMGNIFNQFPFNKTKNVFITEYSSIDWTGEVQTVVKHGLDLAAFNKDIKKEPYILSVVNDFINRDRECGFRIHQALTKGLPHKVIGNTPGYSLPANSREELIDEFCKAGIYLNTSLISPIPLSVLESSTMGCCLVSTNSCAIPDFYKHGESALLYSPNRPGDGREYLEEVLKNKELRTKLGNAARDRMKDFTVEKFVNNWNEVLYSV